MADNASGSETITIRVKDQAGDETFFKVKRTTKMNKVFGAYAQRKGVAPSSLRFLIDGERIDPTETPKSLELEGQDQSECACARVVRFVRARVCACLVECSSPACRRRRRRRSAVRMSRPLQRRPCAGSVRAYPGTLDMFTATLLCQGDQTPRLVAFPPPYSLATT